MHHAPAPPDYGDVSEALAVVASPVRLALLDVLRVPHQVSEIRIRPGRVHEGLSEDRFVARQTVEKHLKVLVEQGFVRVDPVEGASPSGRLYRVEPHRLFVLVQQLARSTSTSRPRRWGTLRP